MHTRAILILLHLVLLLGVLWLVRDFARETPALEEDTAIETPRDAQPGKRMTPKKGIPVFRLA